MRLRYMVVSLLLSLVLLLSGCATADGNGADASEERPKETAVTEQKENEASDEAINETAEAQDQQPSEEKPSQTVGQMNPPEADSSGEEQTVSQQQLVIITGEVPYTIRLTADVAIYSGAGYDYAYVRSVEQDGAYTIVEEMWDEEDRLWGKLKSGIGWIDLSAVQASASYASPMKAYPVSRFYEKGAQDLEYIVDDSEYTVRIAFRAEEPLRDVTFCSMEYGETAMEVSEILYAQDSLSPGQTLIIGVVFYGDMTTYSISFTDSTGAVKSYSIYMSGRNGALILSEYT